MTAADGKTFSCLSPNELVAMNGSAFRSSTTETATAGRNRWTAGLNQPHCAYSFRSGSHEGAHVQRSKGSQTGVPIRKSLKTMPKNQKELCD